MQLSITQKLEGYSKLSIESQETKNREIRALLKASKELKCKDLIVITSHKEAEEEIEWFGIKRKIKFIPLWKWLFKEK